MNTEKLKEIVEILEGTDVSLVEWRNGEERWTVRRGAQGGAVQMQAMQPMQSVATFAGAGALGAPAGAAALSEPKAAGQQITSPFVGTFYRAASPESAAFVEVGQLVEAGQILCIVEAMKLMNEIEAECGMRILEVVADNGQPVEFGEPLFLYELV